MSLTIPAKIAKNVKNLDKNALWIPSAWMFPKNQFFGRFLRFWREWWVIWPNLFRSLKSILTSIFGTPYVWGEKLLIPVKSQKTRFWRGGKLSYVVQEPSLTVICCFERLWLGRNTHMIDSSQPKVWVRPNFSNGPNFFQRKNNPNNVYIREHLQV